jgi:peptidoglycan/xylan/chitin deacetylase (PgdA/CDA1 family)
VARFQAPFTSVVIWILACLAVGAVALAHMAPAPFILDAMAGDRAVWHMPRGQPPTIYLTYDDGPNPATTPDLLDVLRRERVRATFFLIDEHVADDTGPIVRRMFDEGHAVAIHSARKRIMLRSAEEFARTVMAAADRIEQLAGRRPCRAFRPRGGWRSRAMYAGLRRIDYKLIGFGWMLWDVEPFRARTPGRVVPRLLSRASTGDIIVMHDGDDKAPRKPQPQTVESTARLIPELRSRGFQFGIVCENVNASRGT